jgi:hypothetical protein
MNRIRRRLLDIALATIFALSIAAIFVAHEDPFAREALCSVLSCPKLLHARAWEKITYDLGVASLISLLFYVLIVRIPDYQKRQRLKRSFTKHYKMFKEDSIGVMLAVADGSYNAALPTALLDQNKFRSYFKESVSDSQDRWDAFANNLDEYHLKELIRKLELFREEIVFVLNNMDIPDEDVFEFLKRVSSILAEMRASTLDYDSVKSFSRFLWEVFAGFSWATGYRKSDIVEDMIKAM